MLSKIQLALIIEDNGNLFESKSHIDIFQVINKIDNVGTNSRFDYLLTQRLTYLQENEKSKKEFIKHSLEERIKIILIEELYNKFILAR